jgi:hypothetical protein
MHLLLSERGTAWITDVAFGLLSARTAILSAWSTFQNRKLSGDG